MNNSYFDHLNTKKLYIYKPQTRTESFFVQKTELAGVPNPAHRTCFDEYQQERANLLLVCLWTDHPASLGVYSRILHISCAFLSGTASVGSLTGYANFFTKELRMQELQAHFLHLSHAFRESVCGAVQKCVYAYRPKSNLT